MLYLSNAPFKSASVPTFFPKTVGMHPSTEWQPNICRVITNSIMYVDIKHFHLIVFIVLGIEDKQIMVIQGNLFHPPSFQVSLNSLISYKFSLAFEACCISLYKIA